MTRGTVLIVGSKKRETDLLVNRLEKENLLVVSQSTPGSAIKWLKKNVPQALLFADRLSKTSIERVLSTARDSKKTVFVPAILLADDAVSLELENIKSIGEVFYLHRIPLAQVVRRLRLAIQLAELTRNHYVRRGF